MIVKLDAFREWLDTPWGKIKVSCKVRNELNGLRQPHEVVHSERKDGSEGVPYYPRPFPYGSWKVYRPVARSSPYLAPRFTPTDANQLVESWSVKDSVYDKPSGTYVADWGYGLHCSTSSTTLGCVRFDKPSDEARWNDEICKALDKGDEVIIIAE